MFFIGIFLCGFNKMMHYFDIFERLFVGIILPSSLNFSIFVKKSDNIRQILIGIGL